MSVQEMSAHMERGHRCPQSVRSPLINPVRAGALMRAGMPALQSGARYADEL